MFAEFEISLNYLKQKEPRDGETYLRTVPLLTRESLPMAVPARNMRDPFRRQTSTLARIQPADGLHVFLIRGVSRTCCFLHPLWTVARGPAISH